MKTKITILTVFLAFIMTACSGFEDNATLTLYLGGGSNSYSASSLTNWPPANDDELGSLSYEIKLTSSSNERTETASGLGPISFKITPEYWTIEVTAYSDSELYAYGFTSATLKAGQNNVLVTMRRMEKYEISINIISSYTIIKGGSYTFNASTIYGSLVNPADKIHDTYKWSVSGERSGATMIDESSGYLMIGLDEAASALTIRAESAIKPSIYKTVTIPITPAVSGQLSITEEGHTGTDVGKIYIYTVLKVDTGAVTGAVGTPTYKWWIDYNEDGIFDETDDLVSTDQTYTVSGDDINKPITVEVTYDNGTLTATTNSTVNDIRGIYNLDQVMMITEIPGGDFILINNLEFDISPLCNSDYPFTGTFDGNGKTIDLNIIQPLITGNDAYAGLFAIIDTNGVVKNLKLTGSVIVSAEANMRAGAVAGENRGNIFNVSSSVNVDAEAVTSYYITSYYSYVGGIAGLQAAPNPYTGSIKNCYVTGNITSTSKFEGLGMTSEKSYAGGIAGIITNNGTNNITHCWASGIITANNDSVAAYTAGIVGYVETTTYSITNCVALNSNLNSDSMPSYCSRLATFNYSSTLSNNYANTDITVNGSPPSSPFVNDSSGQEGGDVSLASASIQSWWQDSTNGPGWNIQNTNAAANEINPWYWGTDSRPRLWFE